MFDMLTLDSLYALHSTLATSFHKLYRRLISPDGQQLLNPLGQDWRIISAAQDEISQTMDEVFAEIQRREAAAICRTCGFLGCPGAPGADCPRWPARDGQARADA